jgi:membrane associated rhomboid family serine protease
VAVILGGLTGGRTTAAVFSVYRSAASRSHDVCALVHPRVPSMRNYQHFIGNIALVLVLGPIVERSTARYKYSAMILITALVAGAAHMLISSNTALMGDHASCSCSSSRPRSTGAGPRKCRSPSCWVAILYLGGELVDGVFVQDNISQISHIIGGLCGIARARCSGPRVPGRRRIRRFRVGSGEGRTPFPVPFFMTKS